MKFCSIFGKGFVKMMFETSCIVSHVHYNNVSCIFMHTYLQVSIFFILYLVGAFLIVSLCPSLFVSYFSCIMAPKCKSILSRNLLHSGTSSSSSPSNPTPSHVRFRDEKAKSDFLENFSWRGVHLERQVVLSDFSDIDLPIVIYSKG